MNYMTITCRTCKKDKLEESYGFYAGRRRRNCDACRAYLVEYSRKNREHLLEMRRFRYQMDPERKRAKANATYMRIQRANPTRKRQLYGNHLMRRYGITIEDYDRLVKLQENKCAICGGEFQKMGWNRPCVDHCHRTNKVRGILCRRCNISLHYIEDFKFLEAAQDYLRVNETKDKEPS
jgi:hypothetical protein